MKLSLKEQLIMLSMQNVSIKDCWLYLKLIMDLNFVEKDLDLYECHKIIESIRSITEFKHLNQINVYEAEEQIHEIRKLASQSLVLTENNYPSLWRELPQPPLIVYYKGNIDCLNNPLVSIVGTRKMTPYGSQVTKQMTESICEKGWGIVSGLSVGVDRIVHQTAQEANHQSTIAIIPTGFNQYYPLSNAVLQQELSENHLVISEYLPDTRAQKHHFIMRNRLVAGLTPATLVIEASVNSGSLITANYALQFNREVFALPGRVTDIQSRGCNQLIESGATPILSCDDVIENLQSLFEAQLWL